MKQPGASQDQSASALISQRIAEPGDWRGETLARMRKLIFAKGASLKDPARLFNSSLDGNVRRAIDIREGGQVDATAFKTLIHQAIALHRSRKSKPARKKAKS